MRKLLSNRVCCTVKSVFIVSVLLSLDLGVASAYEPAVQWQKTFGGSALDEGYSVRQTSDGGYIIAGTTTSFGAGGYDVYLVKTDSAGNLSWQRTFGGDSHEVGFSVQQTTDGGYIIAGMIESFGAGSDYVYLIKTDPNGNKTWQKTFSGTGNGYGQSVQQTTDGGYIIAGTTSTIEERPKYDVYLIKTDSNGDSQWQKTFGDSNNAWGYSVQQTTDGGYIITGCISGGGAYLVKTDSDGNLLWQKTFFGGSYSEAGSSVQQTTDGGYVIAGARWNIGGPAFGILIKTDSNGDSQWEKTFGGSYDDSGRSVQQTSDGGYIIAGVTASLGAGSYDIYLIKLSSEVCQYVLFGDVNNDCKFDFYDFAIMTENWLIDCNIEPDDPACVPE